jgi:hypothetical protein
MSEPVAPSTDGISKLDVIGHHLIAAMQMIAIEANPISTHLLVMAADELIISLADARGVLLDHDYRIYIQDEFHEQYRRHIRKPYNYFKHADRDAHEKYEGPPPKDLSVANELATALNVTGYLNLGGARKELCRDFIFYMAMRNPQLFKKEFKEKFLPELRVGFENARPHIVMAALREFLRRKGLLPT